MLKIFLTLATFIALTAQAQIKSSDIITGDDVNCMLETTMLGTTKIVDSYHFDVKLFSVTGTEEVGFKSFEDIYLLDDSRFRIFINSGTLYSSINIIHELVDPQNPNNWPLQGMTRSTYLNKSNPLELFTERNGKLYYIRCERK